MTKLEIPEGATELEDLVTLGLEVRESSDNLNWYLGDLALECTRRFGNKIVKEFARQLGLKASTLRRYRLVSSSYEPDIREAYRKLTWSHFRQVASREDRHVLLTRADNEGWSCDKLIAMTRKDKKKVIDDGKHVPPQPELAFDTINRLWYIQDKKEDARALGYVK